MNVLLGALMSEASRRRGDARLFLVSLTFLCSAGFLGLHALATPGVVVEGKNAGFVLATPVGLLLAAGFAAASSLAFDPERSAALMRLQLPLRLGLFLLMAVWGIFSVARLAPLHNQLTPAESSAPLKGIAAAGVVLYAFAAVRYYGLHRRRPSVLLLGVIIAFALLAEALIAIAFARNWHASWWEWHVLMATAFALVAITARSEYRRSRSAELAFSSMYLEHTIGRLHESYGAAVRELVEGDGGGGAGEIARQHGLSGDQAAVLERAAAEIRQIDELFRPYLSPQVAKVLRSDPRVGELGGVEREISVLFADLQGFTSFSERAEPAEVFAMLNSYWGLTVPVLLREHEGMIERFAGDAVMVVFNAALDQPDHAMRAARAALAMLSATEEWAQGRPDWPRFRAGINTGSAVIGNVGTSEQRSFTAIGDTTNLASRLQSYAQPGHVVIGGSTRAALGDSAVIEPLGPLELKGKAAPVEAFVLVALR